MGNLSHMGVFTDRPDQMRAFYEKVLGMVVTDAGQGHHFKRNITFLTGSADHHHQLALVERADGDPPGGAMFQISFEMDDLDELRSVAALAEEGGAVDFRGLNHGNSWSLYFRDPDGNNVEIYTDTGWYVAQPFGDPLDLSLSNEAIITLTDERISAIEGAEPAAQWAKRLAARLEKARA